MGPSPTVATSSLPGQVLPSGYVLKKYSRLPLAVQREVARVRKLRCVLHDGVDVDGGAMDIGKLRRLGLVD